jgi:hypothetical protein
MLAMHPPAEQVNLVNSAAKEVQEIDNSRTESKIFIFAPPCTMGG